MTELHSPYFLEHGPVVQRRYGYLFECSRPHVSSSSRFDWTLTPSVPWSGPYEIASNDPELVLERFVIGEREIVQFPGAPIAHFTAKLGRLPIEGPPAPPGTPIRLVLFNPSWATTEPYITFFAQGVIA